MAPPTTDAGSVLNAKWSFSLSHNRVQNGGWAREQNGKQNTKQNYSIFFFTKGFFSWGYAYCGELASIDILDLNLTVLTIGFLDWHSRCQHEIEGWSNTVSELSLQNSLSFVDGSPILVNFIGTTPLNGRICLRYATSYQFL